MVSTATLAAKIVEKGLSNMDFSMLPNDIKYQVLTATGEVYLKTNDMSNAIKSFLMAGNNVRLSELGNDLLMRRRFEAAALCFIPLRNIKCLEQVGLGCAEKGNFRLALRCFEAAGSRQMVEFLKANYQPTDL